MLPLFARVHIRLPQEAQIVLAIIGAVLVGLFLFAWFFGTFGKKGLIAVGATLALFGVAVGVYLLVVQLGYREDARIRQEQARANAERLRKLLKVRPTGGQPFERACRAFAAPVSRPGAMRERAYVTLAWASADPAQEILFLSEGEARRLTLTDAALVAPTFELESALRPEFFFVATKERVAAGWRVTVTVDRAGTTCTGSVLAAQVPDDEMVAIGLCQRLGWECGEYDKQTLVSL